MEMIKTAEDLGRIVRERRHELAITQSDLAMVAGTGTRFVHDLERGKPTVRLDEVLRVLAALGLTATIGRRADAGA